MKRTMIPFLAAVAALGFMAGGTSPALAQSEPVDEYGQRCIVDVVPEVREQVTQPGVYEVYAAMTNRCGFSITLDICVAGTRSCSAPTANPRTTTRSSLIGIVRTPYAQLEWGYLN